MIKIAASIGVALIMAFVVAELIPAYQVARHAKQAVAECGEGEVRRVDTGGFECNTRY